MLNDPSTPADLPDNTNDTDIPYAAVDRIVGPPAPARPSTQTPSPPSHASPPSRQSGARSPRASRTSRIAVALVVVLLAVTGVVTWRWTSDDAPVALPGRSGTPTASQPSASGSGSATPSQTPTPSTTAPSTPGAYPAALAAFYTQPVDWKPCSGNAQQECATIQVPVDYAKPGGDSFTLALRRVPAKDQAHKVGSLLINPGGPGGSGVEYAQYADYVFSKNVLRDYDIIGFDPRGIGASSAVSCLTDNQMDQLFADDPTPDTPAERAKLLGDADAIAKACAVKGGLPALHMSSTEVARDMDVIRELVGDRRLNYFGVSYGTFLGALYADLFPAKVGRFVLDSAMSPNQTDEQQMDYDIQGFESSIDAFIGWCVARDDCALGRDKAAAKGKIVELLDTIDTRPLRTSSPGLATIGEGWVGFAIFMCLYSESAWPSLNKGLGEAINQGTGNTLLAEGMSVVHRAPSGAYAPTTYLQAMLPVRCADWARTPDTAALRAARAKARTDHPLWAWMTGELYDSCKAWPAPGRAGTGKTLAVGAAPILVIGNLRDPATPIGGTKQLAKDLASGILVTSDHDGHGTYYAGNSCVDALVDDYLMSGKVPGSGTAC